jgi:hypothetical protein
MGKLEPPLSKEVTDSLVTTDDVHILGRAFGIDTCWRLNTESPTISEHVEILNGFHSRNEGYLICAAAKFTALAGKWYPQFVGGSTQLAIFDSSTRVPR